MVAYPKADSRRLLVFIFMLLLLLPLCACTVENQDAATDAAKMEEDGSAPVTRKENPYENLEAATVSLESSEEILPVPEDGTAEETDAVSSTADAAARAAEKIPRLWVECSPDKDIQAKYDIMHETACKTVYGMNSYNQYISRVLYEYLQKNESGKENNLVENFNEWYSTTAEMLQKSEEDERINYFTAAADTYTKPITDEIEGKFASACEYTQYLFTHARYMFHFFPSPEYRRQINGVVYGFSEIGNRCLEFFAYPIDKERTYANYTVIPLDGKLDLYTEKCMMGTSLEYNGRLYRFTVDEIGIGIKHVLYELEQNKLNYKSICEIK